MGDLTIALSTNTGAIADLKRDLVRWVGDSHRELVQQTDLAKIADQRASREARRRGQEPWSA